MKEKSLRIRELSFITGISEPTLKRLRTDNNSNPTLDVLMKLSSALEIPIDSLVSNTKDELPIFMQDTKIHAENSPERFTMLITKKIFEFPVGTRVVFEKYSKNKLITKYIMGVDSKIYQKIDTELNQYLSDANKVVVIEKHQILAIINREIYEVDYVQI